MRYRKFGKLDWNVSALGFGCMRLPTADGVPMSGNIDEKETVRMVRRAIDEGVNYVDTAYPYHNGNSEVVVGKALRDGYREKVKLATKSPVWLLNGPADFDKYLDEQLARLGTEHIDFYLFHALDRGRWNDIILKHGILERATAAQRAGKIGELGFSFHDDGSSFAGIVDGFDGWSFCQIQYNYMDTDNQAGAKGLRYAASKGLAVVVMEPLLGGRLVKPPKAVQALFNDAPVKRTPAEWAFQWLWDQPEVAVVLSGMGAMEQVEENLAAAKRSGIGSLSADELRFLDKVVAAFRERAAIPCTKCNYCMPCPRGVAIPQNFELYNNGEIYENMTVSRHIYNNYFPEKIRSSACVQCRACEKKCPQKIAITDWMPKVHAALNAPHT